VFAPTNSAVAARPPGTIGSLLKPAAKKQLVKIPTCHVVATDAMSEAIRQMVIDDGGAHPVKTIGGCVFSARYQGGAISIDDENGNVARVSIADVDQSNGVIHVIDKVLPPKS
jgi:uncharacterized surface protein with fasciclin (FAS1) repeats